mmetsp:Transcript_22899/g.18956  ORF Transcript_22899/g.18956 Transcript_22899/m.18956 type:complete len:127 (+) Transcript_22899:19-399(+)
MIDHVIDRIGMDINIMSSYSSSSSNDYDSTDYYQIDILRLTLLRLLSNNNNYKTMDKISNWLYKCIDIAYNVNSNANDNYESFEYLVDRNDNIATLRDEVIDWKVTEHIPKSAVWATTPSTTTTTQ